MSRKNPTAIASIKKIHGVEIEDIQDEPTGTPVKNIKPVKKAAKKTIKMDLVSLDDAKSLEAGIEKMAKEAWAVHPNNPANKTAEVVAPAKAVKTADEAKLARRAKRAARRAARKAAGTTPAKAPKAPKAAKAAKVAVDPTPAICRALLVKEEGRLAKKGVKFAQMLKAGKFASSRAKSKVQAKLKVVGLLYKAMQTAIVAHDEQKA